MDEHLLSRDGRELVITAASVDDAAKYTCVARNLVGHVEKHFDLAVNGTLQWSKRSIAVCRILQLASASRDLTGSKSVLPRGASLWIDAQLVSALCGN